MQGLDPLALATTKGKRKAPESPASLEVRFI